MRSRSQVLLASTGIGLVAALLLASLMKNTETTIAKPEPGKEIPLERLFYKLRWEARVASVRLDLKSEANADPILAQWVFTGSNADAQVHRVDIQVRLLDEASKEVGWFTRKHALPPGARDYRFSVPIELKAETWKETKRVRIVVGWIT
jgi:hypothetical protein